MTGKHYFDVSTWHCFFYIKMNILDNWLVSITNLSILFSLLHIFNPSIVKRSFWYLLTILHSYIHSLVYFENFLISFIFYWNIFDYWLVCSRWSAICSFILILVLGSVVILNCLWAISIVDILIWFPCIIEEGCGKDSSWVFWLIWKLFQVHWPNIPSLPCVFAFIKLGYYREMEER